MYTYHACSFHANEQECRSDVAASPGKLPFGKALSCAVSVVKAGHVQNGAATSFLRREVSVFVSLFGKSICFLFV